MVHFHKFILLQKLPGESSVLHIRCLIFDFIYDQACGSDPNHQIQVLKNQKEWDDAVKDLSMKMVDLFLWVQETFNTPDKVSCLSHIIGLMV